MLLAVLRYKYAVKQYHEYGSNCSETSRDVQNSH